MYNDCAQVFFGKEVTMSKKIVDIKSEFEKDKKFWKKQKDIKWIFKYDPYHRSLKEKLFNKK